MAAELDTTQLIAVAAALGWASGLRLYAVVFLTGLAVLQQPVMLYASGALLLVEFLADKVPWVDSLWDSVHTFIRIPAGAALAYGVFGGDQATWAAVAALLGGTLAATAHTAKATARAAVNTSPEPFSNIGLSLAGDALVPGMLWLSWQHPELFFVALALALVAMVVITVWLFKFLRGLAQRLRGHFLPLKTRPGGP